MTYPEIGDFFKKYVDGKESTSSGFHFCTGRYCLFKSGTLYGFLYGESGAEFQPGNQDGFSLKIRVA